MARPKKDGMFTRFTAQAMGEIVKLVPDFQDDQEAQAYYKKITSYSRFKKHVEKHLEAPLPSNVTIRRSYEGAYRCTVQVGRCSGMGRDMELLASRANPMEVLHILAHFLQPSDSKWHGGEFSIIFLDLIERMHGKEIKRAVKDILINYKIKTSVRSDSTREKQTEAYYRARVARANAGLKTLLAEVKALQQDLNDDS